MQISVACYLAAASALGGTIGAAKMDATAQMQVEAGSVLGCGWRVVAVGHDGTSTVTAVDFSFNIYRFGGALVKAGVRSARPHLASPAWTLNEAARINRTGLGWPGLAANLPRP